MAFQINDVLEATKHGMTNKEIVSLVPCACSLEGATQKCYFLVKLMKT